jgi:NaMN:DMB phosphoribosyltransferase
MESVRGIVPADEQWRMCARQRLDTLTKPLGSLGRLEDIAAQLVAPRGFSLRRMFCCNLCRTVRGET